MSTLSQFFDPDAPLMRFLSAIFDFAILNLLALLCCLPVITAGASLSALYAVLLPYSRAGTPLKIRSFLGHFRQLLPRITPIWIAALALAAILFLNFRIVATMPAAIRTAAWAGQFFLLLCLLLCLSFLFPLAALHPAHQPRSLVKRALVTALAALPRALVMTGLHLSPLALLLFFPGWFWALTPFWLLLWLSLSVFLCCKLSEKSLPSA